MMPQPTRPTRARLWLRLAAPLLLLAAACTSPDDRATEERLVAHDQPFRAPAPFDWSHPEAAARMGAEEAANRIGSFEWTATVDWTVSKGGEPRVHATELHRVRQLHNGDFEVQSDIDPGRGPGSESGKHVIYVNKMTYARSHYAPFGAFRERPTDRGRDARRYRDESFGLLADLSRLFGSALVARPGGDGTFLSRPIKRLDVELGTKAAAPAKAKGSPPVDADTQRRLAFLEGCTPLQADGQWLLDAETGVPLKVILTATCQVKERPELRTEVRLRAQVRTLGDATPAIARPKDVLPDERKPKGVARALEAAGFKKRGAEEKEREEPEE